MASVDINPLWRLVRDAMVTEEMSYREVERKSGGALKRGDLGHWKNGTIKHLSPVKLIAASETLKIDLGKLVSAALDVVGLEPSLDQMIDQADLPPIVRQRLMKILREHRATETPSFDRQQSAARTRHKPDPGMSE